MRDNTKGIFAQRKDSLCRLKMSKILFIGDIVGKPGRKILREVLPQWKEKYKPDVVIVNVENLAHGKGVTPSTLAEIDQLDIDCFTSGNHIFDKKEQVEECFEKYPKLIRPANLPASMPGHGYYRLSKSVVSPFMGSDADNTADKSANYNAKNQQFLIINLHGQIFCEKFFDGQITNPFLAIDQILTQEGQKGDIIIVDFHAEATSEKKTFGFYVDGRVAAVVGTHTHVPTGDAHILTKGTGYISDAGMTGSRDSALGVKFPNALAKFLDPNAKFKGEMEEDGVLQINGVLVEVESQKLKVKSIEKLYQEVT